METLFTVAAIFVSIILGIVLAYYIIVVDRQINQLTTSIETLRKQQKDTLTIVADLLETSSTADLKMANVIDGILGQMEQQELHTEVNKLALWYMVTKLHNLNWEQFARTLARSSREFAVGENAASRRSDQSS